MFFSKEKEDLAPPGHPNPQQKVQAGFGTPAKGGQTRKHTTWPMCAILVAPRSLCIYFNIFFYLDQMFIHVSTTPCSQEKNGCQIKY